MYVGNTIPADWPQPASAATYASYARKPSWHFEEAVALVAGFTPRDAEYLDYRPMDGAPTAPKPYPEAKTWGQLFDGIIGEYTSLYTRARHASGCDFAAHHPYVSPDAFLVFCNKAGIHIPPELLEALRQVTSHARQRQVETRRSRGSGVPKRNALYKTHTSQVAAELSIAGVRAVSVAQLQELVEASATFDRTITQSAFKHHLDEWRDESSAGPLAKLLEEILRREPGRPTDEEVEDQKKRMPDKYATVLWPTDKTRKF
jgi:hypothetical protein